MKFKDLFSDRAALYAKYRPTYPKELFEYLNSLCSKHECAWDCGTGNGQSAVSLASYFKKVIATDPSQKQLENAKQLSNIEYRSGTAENAPIDDSSIDLVCVAQAIHWFDHEKFYKEVYRVIKPSGGTIGIWAYGLLSINSELDSLIADFYENIVGGFWQKERRYIDQKLLTLPFPFEENLAPNFKMQTSWNLDQLCAYFETWSATQAFIKDKGYNPVTDLKEKLTSFWKAPRDAKTISFDLHARFGNVRK